LIIYSHVATDSENLGEIGRVQRACVSGIWYSKGGTQQHISEYTERTIDTCMRHRIIIKAGAHEP